VIADLHNHYPMHLVPDAHASLLKLVTTARGRWRLLDQLQARVVGMASRIANYQSFHSGPRSTIPLMRAGGVGVALSVLYVPFDEMDADKRYHHPPSDAYIHSVLRHLDEVEEEIAEHHADQATVARNPGELDEALAAGRVTLVHCLEGGFHLGLSPEAIQRAVDELAERGSLTSRSLTCSGAGSPRTPMRSRSSPIRCSTSSSPAGDWTQRPRPGRDEGNGSATSFDRRQPHERAVARRCLRTPRRA